MRIKVDRRFRATLLSAAEYQDFRRYYETPNGALIVCRNGLTLEECRNHVVDAQVGWDVCVPGFTADESRIGKRRTKVTIYRVLPCGRGRLLSTLLKE